MDSSTGSVACKVEGRKPCLPYGWIVKQSSSYPDRVYFFNTLTGASSWEQPVLNPNANDPTVGPVIKKESPNLNRSHLGQSLQKNENTKKTLLLENHNRFQSADQIRGPDNNNSPGQLPEVHTVHQDHIVYQNKSEPKQLTLKNTVNTLINQPPYKQPFLDSPSERFLTSQIEEYPSHIEPQVSILNHTVQPRFSGLVSAGLAAKNAPTPNDLQPKAKRRNRNNKRNFKNPSAWKNRNNNAKKNVGWEDHSEEYGCQDTQNVNFYNASFDPHQDWSEDPQNNNEFLGNLSPHVDDLDEAKYWGNVDGHSYVDDRSPGYVGAQQQQQQRHGFAKDFPPPHERVSANLAVNSNLNLTSKTSAPAAKSHDYEKPVLFDRNKQTQQSPRDRVTLLQAPKSGPILDPTKQKIVRGFLPIPYNNMGKPWGPFSSGPGSACSSARFPGSPFRGPMANYMNSPQRAPGYHYQGPHQQVHISPVKPPVPKNPVGKPSKLLTSFNGNFKDTDYNSHNPSNNRTANSSWTTRGKPDTGIKSRLTWKKRHQPYPVKNNRDGSELRGDDAHIFDSDLGTDHLDSTQNPIKSPEIQGRLGASVSITVSKGEKRKTDNTEPSAIKKKIISLPNNDLTSKSSPQKVKTFNGPHLTPSPTKEDPQQTRSKLVNDPLQKCAIRKKSRFSVREKVISPEKDGVPNSQASNASPNSKNSHTKPRIRLKRISTESQPDSQCLKSSGSDKTEENSKTEVTELGNLNDPDKIASIQSWVNCIEPPTLPNSSPDTTHSTHSCTSGFSDDKFKIPLETTTGPVQSDPVSNNIGKDFSDSGCSTSTHLTGVPTSISPPETRDITGMEVDTEQALLQEEVKEVRTIIEKEPDQVFGQLTENLCSMDVDAIEACSADSQETRLFIVLDTNALMHHLKFVEELRDTVIKGYGRPFLVIPWVVLQELDGLKNKQNRFVKLTWRSSAVARTPVHFLYNCFNTKHPRVLGQNAKDAKLSSSELEIECNDDRVLQCCQQYKHKFPSSHLVLFTDDINLLTKATISDIQAFNRIDLEASLESLNAQRLSPLKAQKQESAKTPVYLPTTPELPPPAKIQLREVTPDNSAVIKRRETELQLADDIVCELKSRLKAVLGTVLEQEMKSVYEELWSEIVLRKPPWSLSDILDCYEKHWMAVFSDLLGRKTETRLHTLAHHFKSGTGYGTNIRQVSCLLDDSIAILDSLSSKKKYSQIVKEPLSEIRVLKELCKKIVGKSLHVEDIPSLDVYLGKKATPPVQVASPKQNRSLEGSVTDIEDGSSEKSASTINMSEADSNLVKDKFNKTWEAIHSFIERVKAQAATEKNDQVFSQIYERLPVLKQLRKTFQGALLVKRQKLQSSMPQITDLCSALNTLVAPDNNNVQSNLPADKLVQFFAKKSNRPLLQAGLKQLDSMILDLFNIVKQVPSS